MHVAVVPRLDGVTVGPPTESGYFGCGRCADTREIWNAYSQRGFKRAREELMAQKRINAFPDLALARAVLRGLDKVLTELPSARSEGTSRVATIESDSLTVRLKTLIPVAGCEGCRCHVARDSVTALRKEGVLSYSTSAPRGEELAPRVDQLRGVLVDPEYGVVRSLERREVPDTIACAAELQMRGLSLAVGYGRSQRPDLSQGIALLEALERLGATPGSDTGAVGASYEELQGRRLDPRRLGMHAAESYGSPDFRFPRFDPQRRLNWVRGVSVGPNLPIWVPEGLAYYGVGQQGDPREAVLYEVSNGCALGWSLEEAALFGVLEVIERDAFLRHWVLGESPRAIDPDSITDPEALALISAIEDEFDMTVSLMDTSQGFGVPSIWSLALGSPPRPGVVCAGASGLNGQQAIRSALLELATCVVALVQRWDDPSERARGQAMASDPRLVVELEDHALAFGDESAQGRLGFLDHTPRVSADELPAVGFDGDIAQALATVVSGLEHQGFDTVVIDQSDYEHRVLGLSCVKVLVPGLVPMTFGHSNRRLSHLTRIGTDSRPESSVNTWPHPFL